MTLPLKCWTRPGLIVYSPSPWTYATSTPYARPLRRVGCETFGGQQLISHCELHEFVTEGTPCIILMANVGISVWMRKVPGRPCLTKGLIWELQSISRICPQFVLYRLWFNKRRVYPYFHSLTHGDGIDPVKQSKYYGCWCPGSLCRLNISTHEIDYAE